MALPWAGSEWPLAGRQIWREDATLFQRLRADWFKGFPSEIIHKPKNGNEVAWIISQLSAVVQNAGANGVFFNSPSG